MKNKILIILLILTASFAYSNAEQLFDDGIKIYETDKSESLKLLNLSKEAYIQLTEDGYKNGDIYFNIGNICMLTDDVANAILNYKKSLTYSDKKIYRDALNYARTQLNETVNVSTYHKVFKKLFFWHYDVSYGIKLWFGFVMLALLILSIFIFLIIKKEFVKVLIYLFSFLFVINTIFVVSASITFPTGVVMQDFDARNGDNNIYSSAFGRSIPKGSEFTLLEEREGWVKVKLIDGNICWIEDLYVELIQ